MYDNRDPNDTSKFKAIDGSYIKKGDDKEYLKNLKMFLSDGVPVIVDVGGHFVVVVGVESGVELEEATIDQLVIFDPGTNQDKKIAAFGETTYKTDSNRMITPYPVVWKEETGDDGNAAGRWVFVTDENGAKTHDPYYIDPVKKTDGSIVPAETGRVIKKMIDIVMKSPEILEKDRDRIIRNMVRSFTGESDFVYENKMILENGEYVPGDNIRWDKVTVNVPQGSSGILEAIEALPVCASLELEDGYRIDFSVDTEGVVPVQETRINWAYWYPQGGGDITVYPGSKQSRITAFAKVYKDGALQLARYNITSQGWYRQKVYSLNEGHVPFINTDEYFSDVSEASAGITSFLSPRAPADITMTFKFKDNRIYYNTDGSMHSHNISDCSSDVYFNNISSYDNFNRVVTGLNPVGMARVLIELHTALIHTMGYDINYDISNI